MDGESILEFEEFLRATRKDKYSSVCTTHHLTFVPLFLPAPFLLWTSDLLPQKATDLHSENLVSFPQNPKHIFCFSYLVYSTVFCQLEAVLDFQEAFIGRSQELCPSLPLINPVAHLLFKCQTSFCTPSAALTSKPSHGSCVLRHLLSLFFLIFIPFRFAYCSSLNFPMHVSDIVLKAEQLPSGGPC